MFYLFYIIKDLTEISTNTIVKGKWLIKINNLYAY